MDDRKGASLALDESAIVRAIRAQRAAWRGLCCDCVKFDTCTFPRDPARPVWGCDEYVSCDPLNPVHEPAPLPATLAAPDGAAPGELKGLCRTCALAPTCTFPKPPGGVWQCDELE